MFPKWYNKHFIIIKSAIKYYTCMRHNVLKYKSKLIWPYRPYTKIKLELKTLSSLEQ